MVTAYNYPGVYIQEVSSGANTIVGVSTSDTAFVDFFALGPVNTATRITSFDDFVRTFGGLDTRSEASYAIQQFFLNGGNIAWVVRVIAGAAKKTTFKVEKAAQTYLSISAASEGSWGDSLQITIEDGATSAPPTFNLIVKRVQTVNGQPQIMRQELHRNLSLDPADARYAMAVVNDASTLIRIDQTDGPGDRPDPVSAPLAPTGNGADGDAPGNANAHWNQTSGVAALNAGLGALDRIAPFVFNLLCIPAAATLKTPEVVYVNAIQYCRGKRAFLLVDVPSNVETIDAVAKVVSDNPSSYVDDHAAIYFPRLELPDPLNDYRVRNVAASGTVAGIYARTDSNRGVWKAPAGVDASLVNANLARSATTGIPINLTDSENGALNPLGINVIRNFPIYGNVVWGARTLKGADALADDWKYIPVRRLALYIEESLFQGSKWIVFEPNDEPLWAEIRLSFGAFMQSLFQLGAFQGQSPDDAYFVRCSEDTTTQDDIDRGIVNIVVGFAPLKPAEFVVITIQQMAGQVAT